jgi:hypothetical protein
MSGVLERMAKRARAALPTVEPRNTPLFAPAVPELGSDAVPSAGLGEIFAEVESSRSELDRSPRNRRRSSEENDEPATIRDEDSRPFVAPEPVQRTPSGQAGREQDSTQRQVSEPHRQRRPNSPPAANPLLASEGKIPSVQLRPSVENNASDLGVEGLFEAEKSLLQASVKAVANDTREEKPLAPAPISRVVQKEVEGGDELSITARSDAVRPRQPQERRIGTRDSAPVAAPDSPAEQRTEIHISIGNIELRAPRVESRPQPVPFRPRVTLSDFLGRKPEAEA